MSIGNNDLIQGMLVLFILLAIYGLIVLVTVISYVIVTWRLYEKAGKPGWSSLVPVYSTVIMGEISKKPVWIGLTVGLYMFAPSILILFTEESSSMMYLLFNMVYGVASVAFLILSVLLLAGFIRSYKARTAFWVCYLLFPVAAVFMVKNVSYNNDHNNTPMNQNTPQPPLNSGPSASGPIIQ